MSKSTSRLVNMKRIADRGALGVILIRLMMTLSDLVLCERRAGHMELGRTPEPPGG